MDIYEDARTVSRADLAAWLRQVANQLETTGQVFYGAAGTIAVPDRVRCELEIEQEDDEFSVEIEFSWAAPKAIESADSAGEPDGEEDGTTPETTAAE
ncbi:amphi-Trp domain-containing protein [Micromonospora cathayae]|uniref:amphi-Trp domain-containing protein n=1 Tax=Micromonospora cathayae TaxID=3028804 RepID=UPI003C6D8DFB